MKKIFLLALSLTVFQFGFSQESTINLKSGKINLVVDRQLESVDNIKYYFMLFSIIPTIEERKEIANLGVTFLEYIPDKTYVVNLDKECELKALREYGVMSLLPIEGKHKLDPKIQNNNYPKWIINDGKLTIKVLLYKDVNTSDTEDIFKSNGYRIDNITLQSNSITITITFKYIFNS